MKATYIPTKSPTDFEGLTPEGLAATLARYSRSNKGIETLLEESKTKNPQDIFRFIDYGHASIGGLTGGIAIAVDGVSMVAALKLFEFSQMADGQESSTRYIPLKPEELLDAETLGIPKELQNLWKKSCELGIKLYQYSLQELQKQASENPETIKIPEKAQSNEKIKQRLLRNYALDRSRNLLPVGLKTNAALVMSARAWAETIKLLESLQLPETTHIAHNLRNELQKVAPNLTRHSHTDQAAIQTVQALLKPWETKENTNNLKEEKPCQCLVSLHNPPNLALPLNPKFKEAFKGKINRYSHIGPLIKRQTLHVQWNAMAVAELRDLNRHRNGFRTTSLYPCGFQLAQETKKLLEATKPKELDDFLKNHEQLIEKLTQTQIPGMYTYGLFLGSQVPFEHTQPLDKFLYEAELRTGLGAHFRYAELLKTATEKLLELQPELKPYIELGEAEPE